MEIRANVCIISNTNRQVINQWILPNEMQFMETPAHIFSQADKIDSIFYNKLEGFLLCNIFFTFIQHEEFKISIFKC